jgi:dTMP kinase
LAEGQIILVDRFEDSTRAYQGASGVGETAMDRLSDLVLRGLRPNLTVMLDMDPEASLQRVEVRNLSMGAEFAETRFDEAELDFHRKVRKRFLAIAQQSPNRVALIPARAPADEVELAIWARVAPLLRSAGFGVD